MYKRLPPHSNRLILILSLPFWLHLVQIALATPTKQTYLLPFATIGIRTKMQKTVRTGRVGWTRNGQGTSFSEEAMSSLYFEVLCATKWNLCNSKYQVSPPLFLHHCHIHSHDSSRSLQESERNVNTTPQYVHRTFVAELRRLLWLRNFILKHRNLQW